MNDIHKPKGWMYIVVMVIFCGALVLLTGDEAAGAFFQIIFIYLLLPAIVMAIVTAIFS